MNRLIFKTTDLRRVVEHSINAPQQKRVTVDYLSTATPITKVAEAPSVVLVHDDGVYLMSNGEPRDIVKGSQSYVAHAKGCNPAKDADWWEASRALVGGDDFGETLPWANEIKAQIDAGAKQIVLLVRDGEIELSNGEKP